TFMMVVAKGENRERVTLGRYPKTSLADARSRAKALVAEAQDRKNKPPRMTFEEAFTLFKHTHTTQKNRTRTAKDTERIIEKHLVPMFGMEPLSEITTPDVARSSTSSLRPPAPRMSMPRPGSCSAGPPSGA